MTKRIFVVFVSIASIMAFGTLVYYGLRHARGVPVPVEEQKRVTLKVPFINEDIDLTEGISRNSWDSIESKEIELLYQVMVLPWGRSLVSPISVKAFHNGRDIYFYISWKDETENRIIEANKFSDACAILFPFKDEAQAPTILMGFIGRANIWHWKASQDIEYWMGKEQQTEAYVDFYYPFEDEELFPVSKEPFTSAARDLTAIRVGTITPKEVQNIHGRGFWDKGTWHVVFKRSFKAHDAELDAIFKQGQKRLCAFGVWNGEKGDRGGRKSISDWLELEVK